MSTINDVILSVIGLAEAAITGFPAIVVGSLPPDEGICITAGAGAPRATDIDKSDAYELYAVLNGKSADQQKISDALGDIHEALTHTKTYPNTGKFQITNISTVASPNLIGREENSQWLYGSSLRISFYFRNISSTESTETEE